MKRLLSLLVVFAICVGLLPAIPVLAANETTLDISKGSITIGSDSVSGYNSEGSSVTIANSAGYIITGTSTTNTITVSGGSHNITLSGVTISETTTSSFSITSGAEVNLTLTGTNQVTGGTTSLGLYVSSGATLNILAASTGSLTVGGTGIGGGGTVTIAGGTFAKGDQSAQTVYGFPVASGCQVETQTIESASWYKVTTATAPQIQAGPVDQTVVTGSAASFSITASSILQATYRWQVSTNQGTSWSDITGATATTLALSTTSRDMSGNQYRCVVTNTAGSETSAAATLTVKSTDAGVASVSVAGEIATANGTQYTVSLPYGSSLPTANDIAITPATYATVSGLATSDSGSNWAFTVTAEDGTTACSYTLHVTIQEDPAKGNKADLEAAAATLESAAWTVSQGTANTASAVKSWIDDQLKTMNLQGATYTVTMGNFNAAVSDGSNGSFSFSVKLEKGTDTGIISTSTYATQTVNLTGSITATVNAQTPTITTQPSSATYSKGTAASALTVKATVTDGGTLSYQWYEDGILLPGATGKSYTPSTVAEGTTSYYCLVTNTNSKATGTTTATITSSSAKITVNALTNAAAPAITAQPSSGSYLVGATASALSVTATVPDNGTLTYQWYSATSDTASGTKISGATRRTYTPSTKTAGTTYYYCVVINTNSAATGSKTATATSGRAVITVTTKTSAATPTITTQPVGAGYTVGETASALTVKASITDSGTLSYQWYSATSATVSGTKISGATKQSYTPSTKAAGTTYYYCVVTNTNSAATGSKTATATSSRAAITVTAKVSAATPTITTQPVGASYTLGGTASALTVKASVSDSGTLSYQWYNATSATASGAKISGATKRTYTPSTKTAGTTYYYCVITNTKSTATASTISDTVAVKVLAASLTTSSNISASVNVEDLLTAAEAVSGKSYTFTLSASSATKTVTTSEKRTFADQLSLIGESIDAIAYYDISLTKTVGSKTSTVTEAESEIEITLSIPSSLKTTAKGLTGSYYMLRLHNGNVDVLEDLDRDADTITFATDKFSTYAMVFVQDTNAATLTGLTLSSGTAAAASASKYTATVPYKTRSVTVTPMAWTDDATITVSGKTVESGKPSSAISLDEGENTVKITVTVGSAKNTYTLTVNRGEDEDATYKVSVASASHGEIAVSDTRPEKNDTVTVTVTSDDGYQLKSLTVTNASDKSVTVTKKSDSKYIFTMPAADVTVQATFEKVQETTGTLLPQTPTTPFTDIAGNRFESAIAEVYAAGLMNGISTTTFAPDSTLTRAMVVTILYRLSGEPAVTGGTSYSDVASGLWYSDAVLWAAQNGVVTGHVDGTFRPNDAVTREQLAAIFYRYASANGYYVGNTFALDGFIDGASVQSYARPAMEWAVANSVLVSRTTAMLDPGEPATRAEVAQALSILIK